MKAVILARVSTLDQVDGQSLDAQIDRLRDYCNQKNLQVLKEFRIVESSTRGKRKDFHEMLNFIKAQKECIALVVDAVDRLQRSFKESVILDDLRRNNNIELHFKREAMIISDNSPSSNILMWDYGVLAAKTYVLNLSENVKRSNNHKLKKGEVIGRVPCGYLNRRDESGKSYVQVDPNRAFHIKRLFNEYATGNYSIREMAAKVTEWGLTASDKSIKPLTVSQIHYILQNHFYYGVMKIKDNLYPHIYTPLIDFETFERCEAVRLKLHKNQPVIHSEKPFIFKSLIKCGHCGCTVTSDLKKEKYVYLTCNKSKGPCVGKRLRQEKLVDQVQVVFDRLKISDELATEILGYLKSSYHSKQDYQKQLFGSLQAQRSRLVNQKDELINLRLDQRITNDEYDKKHNELSNSIDKIDTQLKHHEKAGDSVDMTLSLVIELASNAGKLFESSKVSQKRQLLRLLFSNLILTGETLSYDLNAPFDKLIDLEQCSNWWA